MSLKGKVLSIYDNGKRAKVLVKPVFNCNGCNACAGIIKTAQSNKESYEIEVLVEDSNLSPHDVIELEMPEYQGSKVAVILYGIPILGFLLGIFFANYIARLLNFQQSDLVMIIGAFSGLFISMAGVAIHLRLRRNSPISLLKIKKKGKEGFGL